MEMSDLEKIEEQHPELKFYMIDVPNPHYHGHIDGNNVYINENQPELDWLVTALHECIHSDYDYGDLSDGTKFSTKIAERWAIRESRREYNAMFNGKLITSKRDRR